MRLVRLLSLAVLLALVSIVVSFRLAAAQSGMSDPTSGNQAIHARLDGGVAQPRVFVPMKLVDYRAILGFAFQTNFMPGWLPSVALEPSRPALLQARRRTAL
jgi:hypothetical protein